MEMKTIFFLSLMMAVLVPDARARDGEQEITGDPRNEEAVKGPSEKGQLAEFAAVRNQGDKLLITIKREGIRFLYGIGENGVIATADYKPAEHGQTIEIPFDRVTVFFERHQSLKFEPAGIGRLLVSRTLDFRSVRRGITVENFTLTAHDTGVVEFGESTMKPLLEETELIRLAEASIKDKIEIPKEAKARVEIKNGVAVVTWPAVRGSKSPIPPGPDYHAQVKLDALTGEVISVLAGS